MDHRLRRSASALALASALATLAGPAAGFDPSLHQPAFDASPYAQQAPLLGFAPGDAAGVTVNSITEISPQMRGAPGEPPEDVWQRIRAGFAMPDLNSPLVLERQAWYADRPQQISIMVERSRRYLFHIVEELEKRGMPTELALLPMVESAFNPMAYSRAKASGLWQFIPSTGTAVQPRPELVVRRPPRHRRLHQRGARLPAVPPPDVRRLASRAGLLQLGRGRGRPRHRAQPRARPGHRLLSPRHARRDALLRPQAAGAEEPRRESRRGRHRRSRRSRTRPTS